MGPRIVRESIDSTQAHAVAEARARAARAGTRIVGRRQSRGTGRADHAWASPPGGLYLSEIVVAPPSHGSMLPIAVGAELAQSLAARYGVHTLLKWPNDLLVVGRRSPRKLAGILVRCGRRGVGPRRSSWASGSTSARPPTTSRWSSAGDVVGLAELVRPVPDLDEVEGEVVGRDRPRPARPPLGARTDPSPAPRAARRSTVSGGRRRSTAAPPA